MRQNGKKMSSPYYYFNSFGSKTSTVNAVNMCKREGPMSKCGACSITDQEGCKYRRKASNSDRCMYWREDMGGACDNSYAQKGIDQPEVKEE